MSWLFGSCIFKVKMSAFVVLSSRCVGERSQVSTMYSTMTLRRLETCGGTLVSSLLVEMVNLTQDTIPRRHQLMTSLQISTIYSH